MDENRGFRPRRGGFIPKPVEVGKEYEVDVQEMSRRGDGIARIQGLVIFIAGAKQGDHVKIKITRISRKFAEATLVGKEEAES
jgi:predicted RNA-binding protein with TRAM domain